MTTVDVLVIGGGIAGTSAAAALAADVSVLVLERESVADRHSTGRSAAALIPSYGNAAVQALTAASQPWFLAAESDAPLLRPRPVLWITGPSGGPSSVSDAGLVPVSSDEARRLLPVLRPEWADGALLDPDSSDLDVAAVMTVLRRTLRERGGKTLLGHGVRALSRRSGGWRVTLTDGSRVDAGTVVNAAGAWADGVATLAGLAPLGLVPCRRTLAACPVDADPWEWPLVCDSAESFYLKPERGQVLVSPAEATPVPPGDVRPDDLDVARGLDAAREATTLALRSVRTAWAGLRTFAPDSTLVLGPDPAEETFVWCAGQGGYGIQTAPAAATVVAAGVLGAPVAAGLDPGAYDPARFCGPVWQSPAP